MSIEDHPCLFWIGYVFLALVVVIFSPDFNVQQWSVITGSLASIAVGIVYYLFTKDKAYFAKHESPGKFDETASLRCYSHMVVYSAITSGFFLFIVWLLPAPDPLFNFTSNDKIQFRAFFLGVGLIFWVVPIFAFTIDHIFFHKTHEE